jgi:hypothetical protein
MEGAHLRPEGLSPIDEAPKQVGLLEIQEDAIDGGRELLVDLVLGALRSIP